MKSVRGSVGQITKIQCCFLRIDSPFIPARDIDKFILQSIRQYIYSPRRLFQGTRIRQVFQYTGETPSLTTIAVVTIPLFSSASFIIF